MKKDIHVLTVLLCAVVAGCFPASAHGDSPDYLKKKMPDSWSYSTDISSSYDSQQDWWRGFEDSVLDSLVSEGMANNQNIHMAVRRIRMAGSQVRQARSAYYPEVSLSAAYTKGRNAGAISGSDVPASMSGYFSLGADMSWEIDIFGKITAAVKNSKAALNVSKADYDGTMLSIVANIVTYYVNLRTFQENLNVTREHLASQAKVVEITKARFAAGLVSKLDVTQAETVYYSTQAQIPQLETSVNRAMNALAVLLGIYPDAMRQRLAAGGRQPEFRHLIAAGVPADLLRRRPDIRAAEAQLEVYATQMGIAKKDFLPSLSINGSIGVAAHDVNDMFHDNGLRYSITPTISWTMFDGLNRNYKVQEAREQMEEGIDNYNLTVLTAVSEVDDAMNAYLASLRVIDSDTNGLEQSTESFRLSVDLYKQGLTVFTNVVDAQINSLTYANSLITARGQALVSLISLYKALGGSPAVK